MGESADRSHSEASQEEAMVRHPPLQWKRGRKDHLERGSDGKQGHSLLEQKEPSMEGQSQRRGNQHELG